MASESMIRVTELLRWCGVTSSIPNLPIIKAAMERGTLVHQWSLLIEDSADSDKLGELDNCFNQITADIQGYAKAVANFHTKFRPTWISREVRIQDEELGVSGCPDRYGEIRGELVVLDFKTGQSYKWHRMQVALYAILLQRQQSPTNDRWCVYLRPDGSFSLQRHNSKLDLVRAWT
jgi:ATP-dependent exoDNAse (exonuclease V) beta subunit